MLPVNQLRWIVDRFAYSMTRAGIYVVGFSHYALFLAFFQACSGFIPTAKAIRLMVGAKAIFPFNIRV